MSILYTESGQNSLIEDRMQYRVDDNKVLSEIGIGGYALSGVYGEKDPDKFNEIVRLAYDKGVTFFDVADIYGPAEEIMGQAVAPFRDRVWLATKVGWGDDGVPDCSAEQLHWPTGCFLIYSSGSLGKNTWTLSRY